MKLPPHIVVDERIRFGKPVIEGTRVPVELILEKLANGSSEEELVNEYQITRDDIHAALHYAASVIAEEQVKAIGR